MKVVALAWMTASLITVWNSGAFAAGARTGNAADWRRIMISSAQREAANWTNTAALNAEVFHELNAYEPDSLVAQFVTHPDALKRLALDIVSSKHVYLNEDDENLATYHTCAWTNDPTAQSMTDIVFALPLCEGGLLQGGKTFANRTVIHESVHHLLRTADLSTLITDQFTGSPAERETQEETFCDQVAEAIHQMFELATRRAKSHWRDMALPIFEDEDVWSLAPRGFHATIWTGQTGDTATANRMIIWGGCQEGATTIYACGDDSYRGDGAIYDPSQDNWALMTADNAPSARAETLSLWTDSPSDSRFRHQMIVWGGCAKGDGCETRFNDGGFYDPAQDKWTTIPSAGDAVEPRVHHGGAWTGDRLIVWGGHPNFDPNSVFLPAPLNNGGIYHPDHGWESIPSDLPNTPAARAFATTIWTGETGNPVTANKMLVWGGCVQEIANSCMGAFNDGALFDPQTFSWEPLSTRGLTPSARHNESAVYVPEQAKLYVFGGINSHGQVLSDGHILDLKNATWIPMASTPSGRFKHKAVWAGDRLMIFGGKTFQDATRSFELASEVIAFKPSPLPRERGQWVTYQTDELTPLKTIEHSAVWTGYSLLTWGGQIFDRGFTASGSQFFPGPTR